MVNNWLNIIQDCLLPPTCILCGNSGFDSQDICPACCKDVKKNINCCLRCAEIFETEVFESGLIETKPASPPLCGHCISHAPAFDTTTAPYVFQDSIRYLITTLKFNRQFKNARLLGYLLAAELKNRTEMPELIIPVPLHKQRYRERGFNQSIEIAKTLSKQLNISLDTKSCIRIKNTAHQIDLPAKQRHKNIKNAFSVSQPIKAQHIAILDDVMTTGSTVNELAKVLKKAGVITVDIWACARA